MKGGADWRDQNKADGGVVVSQSNGEGKEKGKETKKLESVTVGNGREEAGQLLGG